MGSSSYSPGKCRRLGLLHGQCPVQSVQCGGVSVVIVESCGIVETTVSVPNNGGQFLSFKIKRKTPFRKLMDAYCSRNNLNINVGYHGRPIKSTTATTVYCDETSTASLSYIEHQGETIHPDGAGRRDRKSDHKTGQQVPLLHLTRGPDCSQQVTMFLLWIVPSAWTQHVFRTWY